ncbi:peptidase B [Vibrio ponticus]|nr:peptidase B [Vibrio ponticus]
MSTQMSVFLTQEVASPEWGDKAIVSFSAQGAHIHQGEGHDLGAIQRAARQFVTQGIKQIALAGEGWDLEGVWAFHQASVSQKIALHLPGLH